MPETPLKPVYVLHGKDDYTRRQRRGEIVSAAVGDGDPEMTVARFDADAALADVLDGLRTLPFLAPRRVVVVDGADEFVTAHREALEEYVGNPSPTGCLVLVVDSWDARTRLARAVAKIGSTIDCSPPPPERLPKWIAEAAQTRGKSIARDAAALLAERIGADLARLDGEIEKLSLFVGPRKAISSEDVAAVVAAGAGEETPFALANALQRRQLPQALAELDALITRPGEEFRALGMIAWHLRRSAARADDFRAVLAADLAMKSGSPALATMQLLVARLCLGPQR